jgi:hypothetical protein
MPEGAGGDAPTSTGSAPPGAVPPATVSFTELGGLCSPPPVSGGGAGGNRTEYPMMIAIDRMRNRTALRSMAWESGLAGQVPAAGSGAVLTAPDRIRPRAAGDSETVDGPSATRLGPRRDGPPPQSRTPNSSEGSDTLARAAGRRACDTPTKMPDTWSRLGCGGIESRMNAGVSFFSGVSPGVEQRGDPLAQCDHGP